MTRLSPETPAYLGGHPVSGFGFAPQMALVLSMGAFTASSKYGSGLLKKGGAV